jgi:hypothetical protein
VGLFIHEQLLALMPDVDVTRFEDVSSFVQQHGYELHYTESELHYTESEFSNPAVANCSAVLQPGARAPARCEARC